MYTKSFTPGPLYVNERFTLAPYTISMLHDMEPEFGFNGYGEFIFYRTYSRQTKDGRQENWADCVIRVIEGTLSIRKDWYLKNHISWNERQWQIYAKKLAWSIFKMFWMPPGRGLWAMGTDFVYERGGMALQNCGYTEILDDLAEDFDWIMDALMLGTGVGFSPVRNDKLRFKNQKGSVEVVITDDREGWTDSVRLLLKSYQDGTARPKFIYEEIRGPGIPIKGFGGLSSGPDPLIKLHCQIDDAIDRYMTDRYYDSVILKTDIANQIGTCVVSGNVRRSAEKGNLSIKDPTFKDLKDYDRFPERAEWGWMSNNSVDLEKDEDYDELGDIARRVILRGEPGYNNLKNYPLGRIGKKDNVRKDRARGSNPCGEQLLEGGYDIDGKNRVREVCNVDETCPTRCPNNETWLKAAEFATFYASTVSLLPTHQPSTNRVLIRNRRIGVSIIDVSGWKYEQGTNTVTKWLRKGYEKVREANRHFNGEAGIPESVRVTTIKPGGTVPKLVGKTPGAGYPTFRETLRRTRVARNSPISAFLIEQGLAYEPDVNDPEHTLVFDYPIVQGPAPPATEVSLWQSAMDIVWLQREWADNAVSNTLYFKPKWELRHIHKSEKALLSYLEEKIFDYTHYLEFCAKMRNRFEEILISNYKIEIKWDEETDDFVSAKIYRYNPHHEEDSIEPVLSTIAPATKNICLLPHSPYGVYAQMPELGISKERYDEELKKLAKIDWGQYKGGSDGDQNDDKYCSGPSCQIPINKE